MLTVGDRADPTVIGAPSYLHLAYRPGVPARSTFDPVIGRILKWNSAYLAVDLSISRYTGVHNLVSPFGTGATRPNSGRVMAGGSDLRSREIPMIIFRLAPYYSG